MTSTYYRPSGQAPVRGKIIVALFALGALPLAWLYAWATSPGFPLANLLIAVLMAACLAWLAKGSAGFGKIRHPRWMGHAGAALGLLAWCFQWAVWVAHAERGLSSPYQFGALAEATLRLLAHPLEVAAAANRIVANSTGFAAALSILCWLAELGLFLVPPALAGSARARAPFCEARQRWAEELRVPVQFAFLDDPCEARRRLEQDPGAVAAVLAPCAGDASRFAELTLYRCPGADSFITLTNHEIAHPDEEAHRAAAKMLAMPPDRIEVVLQVDEPVVELLRLPIPDTGPLIRQWAEAALALSAGSGHDTPA